MIARAKFIPLPGFKDGEPIDLPDGQGSVAAVVGDDRACLDELEELLLEFSGIGHEIGVQWATWLVSRCITRSRCPSCGGNTFALTATDRRDGKSWRVTTPGTVRRVVRTEILHCASRRMIVDDWGAEVVCSYKATVLKGLPQGLVPSPKVIRKAQEVIRAAFTPIEEAQHRGIVVGRWGSNSDAWTDATHDGMLAPRSTPQICNPGFLP